MTDKISVRAAGQTDVGRVRSANQDCFAVSPQNDIFLVADGMGGHDSGEIASRMATDHLMAFLHNCPRGDDGEVVQAAVDEANGALYQINASRQYEPGTGMGTTVVGLWIKGEDRYVVFHVGDCRAYLYRSGMLQRLTRDHSLFQAWQDGGSVGPEPKRNYVLRALGPWDKVVADISVHGTAVDDVILLCSDGLCGTLSDAEITDILDDTAKNSPAEACRQLVDAANAAGGRDNITALVVKLGA